MPKKSSYFSNYESPNIVIVPTVNLAVVNKLHDTAATVANTYSSASQQNITNINSNVSLETRDNNLVNYNRNVTVSGGISGNLEIDASKQDSILPVFPNEVNIEQEINSPCTKYHYSEDLTTSIALKAVNNTLNKEQSNNINAETRSLVNDDANECMAKVDGVLESFVTDNQPSNHPIGQTNSLSINDMTSSAKPDRMKEKLKCSNDNDHKKYSHKVLQEKQTSSQQPSCSSSQQPSCSNNKKLEEVCINKDNDMKKYLKQLWTRRIEKMKEKCSNEKRISESTKSISKTESNKSSQNMKRKNKLVITEPPKLNKHDARSERIERVKDVKKKRKERREEANKKSTTTIEDKKNKDSNVKVNKSAKHINSKNKEKKISSYVEHKKNKEECNEKKNKYEHSMKIKTKSNDDKSRELHVKKEREPNKTEKRNNYLARKKMEEELKVIRKKSLKRLSTNVGELSDNKRKFKNVNSPLRTTDIRKKLTRPNVTKNCDDEMDLRSILSRKRTKSQCYGESKRFRASTPPRDNLIITVKQDIVPKPLVNKKPASKPKDKKAKKVKLVINISCSNSNYSDVSSNECSSPPQDLSFLDDIDIDGIVDSLDVGSSNCESNASTKEVFIPTDLYENNLNNTTIEVMKSDSQLHNINDLSMNIEESKERFMVSAHNPDEEICNHSTIATCNFQTEQVVKTKVEQVENSCEDTIPISPLPINDDVYEVIDITNDTEVIDLSDDQREKEDEDKLLTTSNETIEDIDDGCIILINDDSKDGMETPHTLENTHDIKQNLANIDNSDVVVIEDSEIDDIKSEMPEKNHTNTKNCKSLTKIEDTIEAEPKLEKVNARVGLNKENHNTTRENKSANELHQNKDELQNKDEYHNSETISRNIKMESHGILVDKPLCSIENMDLSYDASPAKNSVDCITTITNLEDACDRGQLQAAAMKNSNEPTDLFENSTSTNDKLIKTEVPSNLDHLQFDGINNTTKTASNGPTDLITKELPIATNDKRIKTEATSEINELQPAVTKNNTKIGDSKITSTEPSKLNTETTQEAANDKLIKTETISEINEFAEIQRFVRLHNTKTNSSKISSNQPGNLNIKTPAVAANEKLIKTEETSEINKLHPAVVNNNIKTGNILNTETSLEATNDKLIKTEAISEINNIQSTITKNNTISGASELTLNKTANLNTKMSLEAANNKLIKTEAISEINKLQSTITKNNTNSGASEITSNKPVNLNTKISLEAANNKLIKTEAISEINKLQPAVTMNNTNSGASTLTSNKPGNFNTITSLQAANDQLIKTEAISEINKLQSTVTKNNTNYGASEITSNKPAKLNKTTSLEAANNKLIKTEAISEINKLLPVVTKNNINSGASKTTSNKPANSNTKSLPIAANDKHHKTDASSEINKLQCAIMKNNTKTADSKIAPNESANLNTKAPPVAANEIHTKTATTSKISELQPAIMKINTKIAAYKIPLKKPTNFNTKTSSVAANDKTIKVEASKIDELHADNMKNNAKNAVYKIPLNKPTNLNTKSSSVAANDKPIKVDVNKTDELQTGIMKNNTKTVYKIPLNKPTNLNTKSSSVAANDKPIKVDVSKTDELQTGNMKNNTKTAVYKIPLNKPTNSNKINPQDATTSASNSIKTENTSNIEECQNNNTNKKTILNTVQNVAKKENTKSKNPVVKTENSAQDEVESNTQEKDVASAQLYMKSIEKRMFDYLNQKFTVVSCVHQGYFSKIYQCKGENGKLYALKVLASRFRSMGIYKDRMLTDLQKSVKDKYHILEIINNFNFSGEWCFLTEYYPRNLEQALECKTSFHIDTVQILSRQLVAAVSTLTNNQIIHTDIKPAHILLNSTNDQLKLCGFDRSDYNYNIKIIPSFGTSNYRAPEVILGFNANFCIDVWSTALVMHEMATGGKLFPGHFNNDILYKQLCTLGALPFDMVEQSTCAYVHFYGTNFKRQIGNGKWRFEEFRGINNKLRNQLFESYHRDWARTRTSWEVTVDLDKIEMLHRLLERMLDMDPRHRIPIAFAAASEFISDCNVFI